MNIGLIIYGSLDTLSGGYLYDRQLVKHLRAAGHHVEVQSMPWRNYTAHLSDNVRRVGWMRALAVRGYDVLIQDELNHPSLAWLNDTWRASTETPIVSIVHHLRISEQHPRALLPLYQKVERRYLRSVDGFICNSHTTWASVQQWQDLNVPGIVAYPAADHIAAPCRREVVEALAQKATFSGPLQLLFVGNLIARKSLHTLLRALVGHRPAEWHLHVVGSDAIDTDYTRRVRHLAATLHHPNQVTWHGRVDDITLQRIYRASDLCVVPSYEGFGIVYLEAMAYGLPVIAARAGAAHELVTPGLNGQLVGLNDPTSLHNALSDYLDNRSNLVSQGSAARLRYEEHPTWENSMMYAESWLHEITGISHGC